MKLVLARTINNLHVIGYKRYWKSLFDRKRLHLKNAYFLDFVWNEQYQVDKVYMTSMKLVYSKPECILNTRYILFETIPDSELIEIYNSMKNANEKIHSEELL